MRHMRPFRMFFVYIVTLSLTATTIWAADPCPKDKFNEYIVGQIMLEIVKIELAKTPFAGAAPRFVKYINFFEYVEEARIYDCGIYVCNEALKRELFEPNRVYLLGRRGDFYFKTGNYQNAKQDYENGYESYREEYKQDVAAPLAWFLATCPDPKFRNGTRAYEIAQEAVAAKKDHRTLNVLSASYAELGDFKKSVKTQEEAVELLKLDLDHLTKDKPDKKYLIESKEKKLENYKKYLQSYKWNKPWRERP